MKARAGARLATMGPCSKQILQQASTSPAQSSASKLAGTHLAEPRLFSVPMGARPTSSAPRYHQFMQIQLPPRALLFILMMHASLFCCALLASELDTSPLGAKIVAVRIGEFRLCLGAIIAITRARAPVLNLNGEREQEVQLSSARYVAKLGQARVASRFPSQFLALERTNRMQVCLLWPSCRLKCALDSRRARAA